MAVLSDAMMLVLARRVRTERPATPEVTMRAIYGSHNMLRNKGVSTETAKKHKIHLIENNGFSSFRREGEAVKKTATVEARMSLKTKDTGRVELLVPHNVTETQDVTRGTPQC
jgi:hypothetical protein